MTVGIYLNRDKEAVIITDSRTSGSSRQSDSIDKCGEFSKEGAYHGVIFASGNVSLGEELISNLECFEADSLDTRVEAIHKHFVCRVDGLTRAFLINHQQDMKYKASMIPNKNERKRFIKNMTTAIMRMYEEEKDRSSAFQTTLLVVAYDNAHNRVRRFFIVSDKATEIFAPHMEIGSGSDGANIYLASKLTGVDLKKLATHELLFFAIGAYSLASINAGVGGTPKIAIVSENGNKILKPDQTKALANLGGAHLAGYNPRLSIPEVTEYFKQILEDDEKAYMRLAKLLDITVDSLKTMAVPYSAWQERSNSKYFSKQQITKSSSKV